jgi:prepilin-type N-terminal cleavage/methylation domain-containing protein
LQAQRKGENLNLKAGFSLTELVVVLAIVLVVSGLSVPSISRTLDGATLTSAAQQVASIYEQARIRATQDDSYYDVLAVNPSRVCLDLDGDALCEASEPQAQLPAQVSLSNGGIPVALDTATLGFTALNTETSATYTPQGQIIAGLAWNSRGLPCQRVASTAPCSNWIDSSPVGAPPGPVGWVQYLQLRRAGSDVLYAAVTVSPTGRVKIWKYAPNGGGKAWF